MNVAFTELLFIQSRILWAFMNMVMNFRNTWFLKLISARASELLRGLFVIQSAS
jgi:hypothetical protein